MAEHASPLLSSLCREIKAKTTRVDLICQDRAILSSKINASNRTNTSRTRLPEPKLKSAEKPQEPAYGVPQLLYLSGLLPTPKWYKNVCLEYGFRTEVSSLKYDQSIPEIERRSYRVNNRHEGLKI
ncbi:hypothetical protein F511_44892 [Dorcoceras hygrometricum]|uniref:Uncharacterized protein n=1 Tax=Dorcoceras hygrometricum TaxID=472368 RepID=A0A2Z7A4V6_9LAMI|nr:hypothetical protein F511_44892 [Dorcoceras hygrometricum]